jgi:hypothetical protein
MPIHADPTVVQPRLDPKVDRFGAERLGPVPPADSYLTLPVTPRPQIDLREEMVPLWSGLIDSARHSLMLRIIPRGSGPADIRQAKADPVGAEFSSAV